MKIRNEIGVSYLVRREFNRTESLRLSPKVNPLRDDRKFPHYSRPVYCHAKGISPTRFSFVERSIRDMHEGIGRSNTMAKRHADTQSHRYSKGTYRDLLLHGCLDLPGQFFRHGRRLDVLDQRNEFIAAKTGHQVLFAKAALNALADGLEHFIADTMAP
jgi:hypothetical protein